MMTKIDDDKLAA